MINKHPVATSTTFRGPTDTPLAGFELKSPFVETHYANIWPTKIPDSAQSFWFNQAWLNAYSQTMMVWLAESHSAGLIDISKPVYLIQAESGASQFGLALLHKLIRLLNTHELTEIQLCYLFALSNEKQQTQLSNHPDFAYFHQAGQAAILDWDITKNKPLPSADVRGKTLDFNLNPSVFIANGVLSSLPQTLFYMQYNVLYQAQTALIECTEVSTTAENNITLPLAWQISKRQALRDSSLDTKPTKQEIAYRWQPTTIASLLEPLNNSHCSLQSSLKNRLEQYTQNGLNQVMALPIQANMVLEQIKHTLSSGSLLLISDLGAQQASVQAAIQLPRQYPEKGIQCPIDCSLLSANETGLSRCEPGELHQMNTVTKMMLTPLNANQSSCDFPATLGAFQQHFVHDSPALKNLTLTSLKGAIHAISESQLYAHLAAHNYEPKLLALFLPRLRKEGVPIEQRLVWCQALDNIWENHVPLLEHDSFLFDLGLLAIDLSHWALARCCFITLLELHGPHSACLHNLALVALATAQHEQAMVCINYAFELNANDTQIKKLHQNIQAYQSRCDSLMWFDKQWLDTQQNHHSNTEQFASNNLTLAPLGRHHLCEYYLQYRQANTQERLRGDSFNSLAELENAWQTWQHHDDNQQQAHFALIHPVFGFVGCVVFDFAPQSDELDCSKLAAPGSRSAHLSFWIGCDYQGQGFGKVGVHMAIAHIQHLSQHLNVTDIMTSAWAHNTASISILNSLGFKALEKKKGEGVEQEVSYQLSLLNT